MTSGSLGAAFAGLNPEQKAAVTHDGNTVVIAGPGSGKTETLTVKVAHLLTNVVPEPHGVACVTFNREAVREFSTRLADLGIRAGHRLFLGTVHSFCLNRVLRPFSPLVGKPSLADPSVILPKEAVALLQRHVDAAGIGENAGKADFNRLRRELACGADVSGEDERYVAAVQSYERQLREEGLLDFDAIIFEALDMVTSNSRVRELLAARYPWLAVDEYQDLGGPLHRIVCSLYRDAGMKVFAVGDGDQSLYGFTGAHPEFLDELAADPDFREVRLRFNYRAGRSLIAASQAALGANRDYEPDPKRHDPGEIFFEHVSGGLEEQAVHVVRHIIPTLGASEVPLHEVAVLYRGDGPLLTALTTELIDEGLPFVVDKDDRLPKGEVVAWAQRCAAWSLGKQSPNRGRFVDLVRPFASWCRDRGINGDEARERLFDAIANDPPGETPVGDWVQRLEEIDLGYVLDGGKRNRDDADAWASLLAACTTGALGEMTLADFSHGARPLDKLVLSNYHNAKGRQFDAVVLPGLQAALVPFARWNKYKGRVEPQGPKSLQEDRRLFYVGITRARRSVFLVSSDHHLTPWGDTVPSGPSPFIEEVRARLMAS